MDNKIYLLIFPNSKQNAAIFPNSKGPSPQSQKGVWEPWSAYGPHMHLDLLAISAQGWIQQSVPLGALVIYSTSYDTAHGHSDYTQTCRLDFSDCTILGNLEW